MTHNAENDASPVLALIALPDSDYLFHAGEWWVRSSAAREAVSGLHPCVGCGVELDADDRAKRCDECLDALTPNTPIPPVKTRP